MPTIKYDFKDKDMIKFNDFDKDGHISRVTHLYSDLKMKGLGKSMESVDIDEPVIIPQSAVLDAVIWDYTKAEIKRRACELKAAVNWVELQPQNVSDEMKIQMWFSNVG